MSPRCKLKYGDFPSVLQFIIILISDSSDTSVKAVTSSYLYTIEQYITLHNYDWHFDTQLVENAGFVSALKIQGRLFSSNGEQGFLFCSGSSETASCLPKPESSFGITDLKLFPKKLKEAQF